MDKVTEISRKNGVATVKTLGGETLKIPSALYLERKLRVNQPVDPEGYRRFMRERGYPHALEAAMKYLALRERSEQEVRARLRRSCFDENVIRRVLDTLGLHDLVSDARFAGQWVRSRSRKYGKNRIAQELRMKGVAGEEARAALDGLPEEEEYARALSQAQKLQKKYRGEPRKLVQALVRRGYAFGMARRAAEEAAKEDE
ncbi:MAG: regulatory protein RecX [Clostridia bacterium]|nr:regulatory protein RecX [Clostridia bacterium]